MFNIFAILGFGLLLGIKHAFEPDHMVAVTTILSEQKSAKKAALIGTFWGIGHTSTLFTMGLLVIVLKISIPENIVSRLEILVGIMLVVLGLQSIYKALKYKSIKSQLSEEAHEHLHSHGGKYHKHSKSFFIGTVHGLAGSGALMLLMLPLVHNQWEGILFILLFGLGSTISMTFMSLLIGIPFAKSMSAFTQTEKYINIVMGVVSIIFGISTIKVFLT